MEKENIVPITEETPAAEETSNIVKFNKPFAEIAREQRRREGRGDIGLYAGAKTVGEDDRHLLALRRDDDMIAADKYLSRSGNFAIMPEMSIEYSCYIASRATNLPVEFFRRLPPKEAIKVKNRVTNFFYGED